MSSVMGYSLPFATSCVAAAKAHLDQFGYCLVADVLAAPVLDSLRRRLDEQANAEEQAGIAYFDGLPHQEWGSFRTADGQLRAAEFGRENGGVNQRVWMLANKGNEFIDLLANEDLRRLVDHILGEHYMLSSYTANIANPGGVAMNLHTDQWWMPAPDERWGYSVRAGSITRQRADNSDRRPLTVSCAACCNIVWMLDDFTAQNGATEVVPGSHMSGIQPHGTNSAEALPVVASAGSAMVFDGGLWHGTGANTTDAPRRVLLTTFCGPQFRPQENYTVGSSSELLCRAAQDQDLLQLLGLRVWSGYGRTDSPLVDIVDPALSPVGKMVPKPLV